MTCGWCHREPDQHTLSTSGPTRCKYTTHRANCPANFSTKCSDQVIEGVVAVPKVLNLKKKSRMKKMKLYDSLNKNLLSYE